MSCVNSALRESVPRFVGTIVAAGLLTTCVCVAAPAQSTGDEYNIVYSGFGINQHPENVKLYGNSGVQNWVEEDLPSEARIALPEPDQLPTTDAERNDAAVAIGKELAQMMKDRSGETHGRFEVETIQHSGAMAYAAQGVGAYKDLLLWQQMCVTAMQVAKSELSREQPVHVNAVMGSNDTYTLSEALLQRNSQPFDTITMDDGRAYVAHVVRMAEFHHVPTTLITTNGDYWSFRDMIANRDGAHAAIGRSSYIRCVDVDMGPFRRPGSEHIVAMTGNDPIQHVCVVDATGRRNLSNTRDAIFHEAWNPPATAAPTERKTGGIDLSDMSIAYVSGERSGTADGTPAVLFRAPFLISSITTPGVRDRADELRTAFDIGLSLQPNRLFVNLNPYENNRITDRLLAKTDVGRDLLLADLQLKHDTSAITDPRRSDIGREYWQRLAIAAGETHAITQETRTWIVPGTILVDATGGKAVLVDADLRVCSETEYLAGQKGANLSLSASDRLFAELILPILADRVNNAPEYAALRRDYRSLALARWYREQYKDADAPEAKLIGSDSVSGFESRSKWSPTAIWKLYMNSVQHGDYNFTVRSEKNLPNGVRRISISRYFSGGVDFSGLAPQVKNAIEPATERFIQAASQPEGVMSGAELWFSDAQPNRLGRESKAANPKLVHHAVAFVHWADVGLIAIFVASCTAAWIVAHRTPSKTRPGLLSRKSTRM